MKTKDPIVPPFHFLGCLILGLILALLLVDFARAEKLTIVYKHKCPDLVDNDWTCLDKTQAATFTETEAQVRQAIRKVKYKKPLKIISIDPKRPNRHTWEYGAWQRNGKIYFSAMSGCPNARWELERLLRRLTLR